MQAVIAELGATGYGQALLLLEVLGRETRQGVQFQLPLTKATDLKFWARELLTSPADAEHILDIFEQSDLIAPWRESQIICAPMLAERLDEWSRRKLKGKGRPSPEPPQNPEPPPPRQQKKQNSNRKEQNTNRTEQAPERRGSSPESLPSDEAVVWVVRFFKNLGQVPDKKKVVFLFEGRDVEAVKGTCENWRRERNLEGVKYPFSIFMKEFEAHYNPQCESSDGIERRMKADIAREQEQAEKDRAAKTLVVAAQAQSRWKEDREAI
jgi:hypothetical protein